MWMHVTGLLTVMVYGYKLRLLIYEMFLCTKGFSQVCNRQKVSDENRETKISNYNCIINLNNK